MFQTVPAVVAIPVHNEVERIADCLLALSAQAGDAPGVLLLVNGTTDGTSKAVAELAPSLRCPLVVVEHAFAPGTGSAGAARRLAMAEADRMAPDCLPLLTTDADGRVAEDWTASNLRAIRHVDAVFGRAELDPVEGARLPPALHRADALEVAYADVLDEVECLLDPDPYDPWPRHPEHSGASIAVSRAMFHAVGGMPGLALGEDRAFFANLRRADARIRHAPEVRVVVSGRILGRASGGMADTIRRRLVAPDTLLDEALEPFQARVRRIALRRAARSAFQDGRTPSFVAVAGQVGIQPSIARRLMQEATFGAAWAVLDRSLAAERVAVANVGREMAAAVARRNELRAEAGMLAMLAGQTSM